MMIANLINEFRNPYEGYPADLLLLYGAGSIALLAVFAFVMPKVNRKEKEEKVNLVEKEANA
jgi:hypothetical protein